MVARFGKNVGVTIGGRWGHEWATRSSVGVGIWCRRCRRCGRVGKKGGVDDAVTGLEVKRSCPLLFFPPGPPSLTPCPRHRHCPVWRPTPHGEVTLPGAPPLFPPSPGGLPSSPRGRSVPSGLPRGGPGPDLGSRRPPPAPPLSCPSPPPGASPASCRGCLVVPSLSAAAWIFAAAPPQASPWSRGVRLPAAAWFF